MDPHESFRAEVEANIQGLAEDKDVQALSRVWMREITPHHYAYNFSWMGRPIIQFPQDMMAMQELVWSIRPELIVEAGVAHGGSILYYASLLELLGGDGGVIGIDVEIRPRNRKAIEEHPMSGRVRLVEGSSVDPAIVAEVHALAAGRRAIVVLDSNHSHGHVLAELEAYAPLVGIGSYCVVMDTLIEDMPAALFDASRPWGPGNNPKTAVREFLARHPQFEVDARIDSQLLISVAPGGYLKRVR